MLDFVKKGSFPHGIHPPENKDDTSGLPIRQFPFAPVLIVPLSQHLGKPARPVVREGQEVVRGPTIAEADGARHQRAVPIADLRGRSKRQSRAMRRNARALRERCDPRWCQRWMLRTFGLVAKAFDIAGICPFCQGSTGDTI